jgi:hypothetical protein
MKCYLDFLSLPIHALNFFVVSEPEVPCLKSTEAIVILRGVRKGPGIIA